MEGSFLPAAVPVVVMLLFQAGFEDELIGQYIPIR